MPVLRRTLAPLLVLAVASSASTYVIRPGDTLSAIAGRLGVALGDLVDANGIEDPDRVFAGQTLTVPGSDRGGSASARDPATGRVHVVAPGETLTAIAARFATTIAAIVDANGIADADHVRIGTRLDIPAVAPPSGIPATLRASPARLRLVPHFVHWARANGIEPALVMALAWHESGWQNDVVSRAGAIGIGQLLPSTAEFVSDVLIGVALDPRVPEDNIRMTARYLRWLLVRVDGDLDRALAGYFQGPTSVANRGMLPVTRDYIAIVRALRPRFADI